MIESNNRTNPFVGLRPFESSESEIFFGREEQTKRLLSKLHLTNFVAVVGSSGSGKSSLVKAGLIPALKAGFLNNGDHWYFASFRPGDNPLYYFAQSLQKAFQLSTSTADLEKSIQQEGVEEIINTVHPYLSVNDSSLLILVDQFEELFTHFKHTTDQASLIYRFEFVKILLELLECSLPIYVVLTMRSDFIGKCNIFYDLPEALSNSQFLVPRLQSNELVRVIENPIKLYGCKIEPRLTQRILNELKDGEDQLPILEHALNQLWSVKKDELLITEEDYKSIGKLNYALSNHANSIYGRLVEKKPSLGPVISEMFKYIIDFDGDKREGVRQPRKVEEIQKVTGAELWDIQVIYDAFSAEGASFLFSHSVNQLQEDSSIDISHESLMREWDLFRKWKEEEERDKTILERLNEFASDYRQRKRDILTGPEMENYGVWSKYLDYKNPSKREKTRNWAKRYAINFQEVHDYIQISKKKQSIRKLVIWSVTILLVSLSIGFFVYHQINRTDRAEMMARASMMKSELDSIKLEQVKEANSKLATQSTAQEALYIAVSENEKLLQELASLKNTISEKDKVIQSLNYPYSKGERMLTNQNKRLTYEKVMAEKEYAAAAFIIDSLKMELARYKKNISYE